MLLYLFFDSLLCTCPKKMETEEWPEAADSPLYIYLYVQFSQDYNCSTDP